MPRTFGHVRGTRLFDFHRRRQAGMSADRRFSYEQWAVDRIRVPQKCTKGNITCIPLREEKLCKACFASDKEAHEANADKDKD